MKLYLTLALVALLFNFGSTVPRYYRAATEELPVVQTSLEEDLENVVDNENTNVNSEANSVSNVNVLDSTHHVVSPVVSPVVTPVVTPVIAPVVSVEAPTKTQTAYHQTGYRLVNQPSKTVTTSHVTNPTVHTVSNVQTVPVQTYSASVKSPNVPVAKKTYSSVQTAVPAQQQYYSYVPTQQYSSVKSPQQTVYQAWQPQSVVYSQWPQQSVVPQTQTQYSAVKEVSGQQWQPQSVVSTTSQQWQPQYQSVVYSQVPQSVVPQTQQYSAVKDVYSQVPQSVVPQTQQYSAVKEVSTHQWQPQSVVSTSQQWQPHSVVSTSQQWQPQYQSVVYSQVPQQQAVSVGQHQWAGVKDVSSQTVYNTPQSVVTVHQQQPVNVVRKSLVSSVESAPTKSTNVQWVQQSPQVPVTQYSAKTVVQKVPNPLVWKLSPVSKTVVNSPQTVLTGAQLVTDVADETAKSDVVVQEAENY